MENKKYEPINTNDLNHFNGFYNDDPNEPFPEINTDIKDNTICFNIRNNEIIKLDSNGDIYIKGNLITNDMEVVLGMKEFLYQANILTKNENKYAVLPDEEIMNLLENVYHIIKEYIQNINNKYNDENTRKKVWQYAYNILSPLGDILVKCDEENNYPMLVDENSIAVRVFFKRNTYDSGYRYADMIFNTYLDNYIQYGE